MVRVGLLSFGALGREAEVPPSPAVGVGGFLFLGSFLGQVMFLGGALSVLFCYVFVCCGYMEYFSYLHFPLSLIIYWVGLLSLCDRAGRRGPRMSCKVVNAWVFIF